MSQNTIAAKKTTIAAAGLGLALFVTLTAGAGAAQAAAPVSAACAASKQDAVSAQASVNEATPDRDKLAAQVAAQKASRQSAIKAGNVALVGQINVQLGYTTAWYNTMDSSVAAAQANVVKTKAAQKATC